jgi:ribonucleotide monophosphatase NagD (HAD superfamily)
MNYIDKVSIEESKTIAIDFDGVIHSFELGYHDGTIYGTPIHGSIESIKKIAEKYTIVIYTAKAKKDRPLVNGKTGTELVWEWLEKYDLAKYIKDVTAEKPRCVCYIDDKAIQFNNWSQALNDLTKFTNESF